MNRTVAATALALVVLVASGCSGSGSKQVVALRSQVAGLQAAIAKQTAPHTLTPTAVAPTFTPTSEACDLSDVDAASDSVVRILTQVPGGYGLGSGFVVSGGVIVTDAHVVNDASSILVQYPSGQSAAGQVLAISTNFDIAVVQAAVNTNAAAVLQWNLGSIRAGQTVYAVGYPAPLAAFGPPVVTKGSISRSYLSADGEAWVQTDASINPGNSGGPLLDECGRVIGVVTLKQTDAEGIGLAQGSSSVASEVRGLINSEGSGSAGRTPTTLAPSPTDVVPTMTATPTATPTMNGPGAGAPVVTVLDPSRLAIASMVTGHCWENSMVSGLPTAWRCSLDTSLPTGANLLDPCFSTYQTGSVLCPLSYPPGLDAVKVTLDQPLPSPASTSGKAGIVAIGLTTGVTCTFVTGATGTVNGERINYECGDGSFLLGTESVASDGSWLYEDAVKSPAGYNLLTVAAEHIWAE